MTIGKELSLNEKMQEVLQSIRPRLPSSGAESLQMFVDVGEEGEFMDLLLAHLEQDKIAVTGDELALLRNIADFFRPLDTHGDDYLNRADEIIESLTVL